MFNIRKAMATPRIVEQTGFDSKLLKRSMIIVSLVWRYSLICVTDNQLTGSGDILYVSHGRFFEEIDLLLYSHD